MEIYSNVPAVLFLTSCLDSHHRINSLTVDVCFMGYLHYGSACFAEIENKLLNTCLFYRQHCAQRKPPVFSSLRGFFRPAGATRCTDGVIFGKEEGTEGYLLLAKLHPHQCNDKGVGPQKLKFLLRFDQNLKYKRSAGSYPLRDFHKICRVCTPFQDALAVKIWLDLLEGLWSYGAFKLRRSGSPKFSVPLAAKLCVRHPKVFEVQERDRGPLSPCQV